MHYQRIACVNEGHVCSLVLGRPEVPKCIDEQMTAEIEQACWGIRQNADIRVVLVLGSSTGKDFWADPDIKEYNRDQPTNANIAFPFDVPEMIAAIECPVIAAIDSDAWGNGLALALACDLRIASEAATFAVPDLVRGRISSSGITQRLPRTVGRSKAIEMLLTGTPVGAAEALRLGLVHRLTPPSDVVSQASKLARDMAAKGPIALRYVKEAVIKGADLTLAQGLKLECDLYMILQTTQDRVEGITAFREKRQPFFHGQ